MEPRTRLPSSAAALLLLLLALVRRCSAAFQTSFANVTEGQALRLDWDPIDAAYYPLAISARMINRTAEYRANGVMLNITSRVDNGTSWTWEGVPYPLPYVDTGLYQLEIRPATWNRSADPGTLNVPTLARSTYFAVNVSVSSVGGDGTSSSPAQASSPPGQLITGDDGAAPAAGPNKLALALGLSIGISSAFAVCVFAIVLRNRRRRVLEEKRRRRRFEFIID